MEVFHKPLTDVSKICEHYSRKDGVPISYVCTTEKSRGTPTVDIFYRDTPHPDFGNNYFGIYFTVDIPCICNADWVEDLQFGMIKYEGVWYYSRYTHDFLTVGPCSIDGGRSYSKVSYDTSFGMPLTRAFEVRSGEFVPVEFQ